jgi:hypothetical protein
MGRARSSILGHLRQTVRAHARSTMIISAVVVLTTIAGYPVLRMAARQAPLAATGATLEPIPGAGLEAPGSFTTRPPELTQQHASDALYRFALGSVAAILTLGLLTALSLGGARTAERMPEFAIRRAMGASRRILRWSVALEGVLVAALATLLTSPLLPLAERGILARWPGTWTAASAELLAMGLALLASGAIASLLLPYLLAPRPRLSGEVARPLTLLLPAAQMAASLVILVGGALALRHAEQQVTVSDDARAARTVLSLQDSSSAAERSRRYRLLLSRLRDSAEVDVASLGSHGLRLGLGTVETVLTDCGDCAEGMIRTKLKQLLVTEHLASPDTFRALGVSLVAGRAFALSDDYEAPLVAVVTRSLAQRGFQNGDAIGRDVRVRTGGPDVSPDGSWFRVVGIVDDFAGIGYGAGQQPRMGLFLSVLQRPPVAAELLLGRGDAGVVSAAGAHVTASRPESEVILATLAPARWFGRLYAFLGWAMLAIGATGSVVVMRAWLVSLIPELGLRAAVGASRIRLTAMVAGRLVAALLLALGLATWITPGVAATLSHILGTEAGGRSLFLFRYTALLGLGAAAGVALPLSRILRANPAELIEHAGE